MNKKFKLVSILTIFVFLSAFFAGCVNFEQKTTLNADGSGTMKIHYWTKMSNVTNGSVGKFDFEKDKIKENFTSPNSEASNITIEDKLPDSVKHVNLDVSFKDINKLPDAKGFSDIKPSWKESPDGMELKYILLKDTSAANQYNSNEYTISYSFDMPGDIIATNADKKEGKTCSWNYKVSDLTKDIDMTANVKASAKKKTCGVFGLLMVIGIVGLTYYSQRKRRK